MLQTADQAAAPPAAPITKSEFARRRHVSPARVSQWIDEGKISGEAIVGEGRSSQILEAIACAQLGTALDPAHSLGNGLGTKLSIAGDGRESEEAPIEPITAPGGGRADELGEQIRRQQLETLQRRNRRDALEEAVEAGRLVDADAMRREMGRLAAAIISTFEGTLPDFAAAIAAKFQLPQRDVLHLLRGAYREARSKAAAAAKQQAEQLPATLELELESAAELSTEAA